MPNPILYPLTVFYDGSCELCRQEMLTLTQRDINKHLLLVDCSAADFDDTPYRPSGINRHILLNCLHAQDAQGRWLAGVDAFAVIYRSVGMNRLARLCDHPITRPIAARLYPWVVRNRYRLSAAGLPRLLAALSPSALRPTGQTQSSCLSDQCAQRRR